MPEQKTLDLIEEVSKKNPIYKDFINAANVIREVEPTKAYSKKRGIVDSINSLSFCQTNDESVYSTIKSRFGIKDERSFSKSFTEAISGDGKEEKRILTLHSSSLCALLHFYNPAGLQISLGNGKTMYVCSSSFEYKNCVFINEKGKRQERPSNIDLVLYGFTIEDKVDCILFLESKYSEYMKPSNGIYAERYTPLVDQFFGSLSALKIIKKEKGISLFIDDGRKHYYGGIKQMVAHLQGITNYMNGIRYEPQFHQNDPRILKGTAIYFGEIAFEHNDESFYQWEKDYNVLAGVYNLSHTDNEKYPIMVPSLITYQELFMNPNYKSFPKLEPNIALFYGYKQ
jgi:hypothetical protein